MDKPKVPITKSLLDDIFSAPEADVESFMDLLEANEVVVNKGAATMESIARSAAEDRPDQISYPELIEQTSRQIRIQHGIHGEDYVWHIAPHNPKRHVTNYKVTVERALYAIAKIMSEYLPAHIQAKIWLPYKDWDIQEITFKALGLNEEWSFDKKLIEKINLKLFETLNTLV